MCSVYILNTVQCEINSLVYTFVVCSAVQCSAVCSVQCAVQYSAVQCSAVFSVQCSAVCRFKCAVCSFVCIAVFSVQCSSFYIPMGLGGRERGRSSLAPQH